MILRSYRAGDQEMTHYMSLWDESFQAIKKGWKTVEMRLNDEKRSCIKVNDIIEFTNTTSQEKMSCTVVNIYYYPENLLGFSYLVIIVFCKLAGYLRSTMPL